MASSTSKRTCISSAARFSTITLIFCFIGYASGSCAQYGHSCWGGHGKRSFDNGGRNEPRGYGLSNDGERGQWIPSRLAMNQGMNEASPTVTDKYHIRWNSVFQPKAFRTRRFNPVEIPASLVGSSNDRLSNRKENEETGPIDDEIFLIPQKTYENEMTHPSKLQLLKILGNDERVLK